MEENYVIGIGNRIRYLRGGESLPSFAKKLGIHKNTLVRYEKEESLPDVEFVLKLCKIVDNEAITPSWLIEGEGPTPSPGYFKAHGELRGRLSNFTNIDKAQEVIKTAGLSITPERLVGYVLGKDTLSDLELYELCTKIAYYDFEAVKISRMPIEQELSRDNEGATDDSSGSYPDTEISGKRPPHTGQDEKRMTVNESEVKSSAKRTYVVPDHENLNVGTFYGWPGGKEYSFGSGYRDYLLMSKLVEDLEEGLTSNKVNLESVRKKEILLLLFTVVNLASQEEINLIADILHGWTDPEKFFIED